MIYFNYFQAFFDNIIIIVASERIATSINVIKSILLEPVLLLINRRLSFSSSTCILDAKALPLLVIS